MEESIESLKAQRSDLKKAFIERQRAIATCNSELEEHNRHVDYIRVELSRVSELLKALQPARSFLEGRFTEVFEDGDWNSAGSLSGPGSEIGSEIVELSMAALDHLIDNYDVKSVNDVPCGDFHWMKRYLERRPGLLYRGFDVVAPMIERHRKDFPGFEFKAIDATVDILPKADLVFTKEMFLHLTFADVLKALERMKASESTWLLASNHWGAENSDLQHNVGGSFREIDVCGPPINLPDPIWRNKLFGLWRFNDLYFSGYVEV